MNLKIISSISKKILIVILILNFIIFVVYVFLFMEIKKKNETASILLSEIIIQTSKNIELKTIGNDLISTEIDRKKINSYFVQGDEVGVVILMEHIENIGKVSGVNLKIKSVLLRELNLEDYDSNNLDMFEDMKLSLDVDGEWSQVIHFIKLLESTLYSISFERVYLEKDDVEDSLVWNGLFDLSILKLVNENNK